MNTEPSAAGPLEIELIGGGDDALAAAAAATLARLEVRHGHLAIELVDEARIRQLNRDHRGRDAPTDVLSFPVDGEAVAHGERPPADEPFELGDVVICPAHTEDLNEAAVHGVLHLCGFDHETDQGEMLALQDAIVAGLADGATEGAT